MFDLNIGNFDTPGVGLRVEDDLNIAIELVALRQHLVEFVLAKHRPQRCLRELAGRDHEIFHLDDRLVGIDHAEIDHRVDLHRDVVARNHVLTRDVEHDRAQVDTHHLLDERNHDDQAWSFHAREAP